MRVTPRFTAAGRCYLNIGSGTQVEPTWNNLDLLAAPDVIRHDLREPLPFAEATFDAVYASHVLEHLTPHDAARLIAEARRVLKPAATLRIVVPDLEQICREYLAQLDAVTADPSAAAQARLDWVTLELIDQMVRERSGGLMLERLRAGQVDLDYVLHRNGDEFAAFAAALTAPTAPAALPSRARPVLARRIVRRIRAALRRQSDDPRSTGEAHKWMYDRVSLARLLASAGFADIAVCRYDQSRIPDWSEYRLDTSRFGSRPRKPDSLYVEATAPTMQS